MYGVLKQERGNKMPKRFKEYLESLTKEDSKELFEWIENTYATELSGQMMDILQGNIE